MQPTLHLGGLGYSCTAVSDDDYNDVDNVMLNFFHILAFFGQGLEGLKTGSKGCNLEVGHWRGPRFLVI